MISEPNAQTEHAPPFSGGQPKPEMEHSMVSGSHIIVGNKANII